MDKQTGIIHTVEYPGDKKEQIINTHSYKNESQKLCAQRNEDNRSLNCEDSISLKF